MGGKQGQEVSLNDDLSLGSLTNDLEITMEDLGTNPNDPLAASLEDDDKNIIPSEGIVSPESVAGGDDSKIPVPGPGTSSGDNKLSPIYSSLADHLVKQGVLPSLNLEDSKITNLEQLQEAIKAEIDGNISQSQKDYNEALKGGVEKSTYVEYQKVKSQLDSITDDILVAEDERSLNLRKNVIGQDFLNRGFNKQEATKYAQRSIDMGEDVADSLQAIIRLKEHNDSNYETSKANDELEKEKVHKDIKSFIEGTGEVLKGLKLNKNLKDKLYDQIIKPTGNDEKGNPINEYADAYKKDPVRFQVMQNYLFMMTKGYTDFSKLTNVGATNANIEMDELLKNTNPSFFQSGNGVGLETETSFTLGDLEIDS